MELLGTHGKLGLVQPLGQSLPHPRLPETKGKGICSASVSHPKLGRRLCMYVRACGHTCLYLSMPHHPGEGCTMGFRAHEVQGGGIEPGESLEQWGLCWESSPPSLGAEEAQAYLFI